MAEIFAECLAKAVADEKISQATADRYKKLFEDAEKEARALGKGGVDSYTFATSKAAERMLDEVGRRKSDIAREILRTQMLMEDAPKHSRGTYRGLQAILGENVRGGGTSNSVVQSQRSVLGTLQAALTDFLDDLRSSNFGLTRDRVAPRATAMELYGKASGTPGAKENATAWTKMMDWWMGAMENEGVRIRKLEDWRLPQQFNTLKVKALGKEGFVDAMQERWQNGGLRLRDFKSTADDALLTPGVDDARVREILGGAYDGVATKGNSAIEPGLPTGETMADRYNRRRVFEWTSPESYFDFMDTFGQGSDNLGEQIVRHLHGMAMDLGTARVLGSDPDKMAKTLVQFGQKAGITDAEAHRLEKLWFHSSGRASEAASVTLANSAAAVRSWLSGAQLGGAVLSSTSDFAFLRSTAAFNGLGATKVMTHYLAELAGGADARRASIKLGLINETGLRGLRDHFAEVLGQNISKPGSFFKGEGLEAASAGASRIGGRAAEFVMRATGLEAHSNIGRAAWGKGQLGLLAENAGRGFEKLDDKVAAFLQRYGIDGEQWDVLRNKAMHDERLFMDPAWLAYSGTAAEREPALRLLGAIDAESKYAIPEGGVTTRSMLLGTTRPGTFSGEVLRSMQYKGFAMSATILHGWRAVDRLMDQGYMAMGQYLGVLAIEATVLGALGYQLKNIAAGKDPEAMDTHEFWLKAAAMGGAGGMLGDQIKTMLQTQSRADAARLLTPTAGLLLDAAALSGGNLAQAVHGDKTNAGREAANFGRKYALPRLWYTSLGVDRLGWDTLQRMADPDAAGAFRRIEQRSHKDSDVNFYWRPGQTEPSRPPDLERALGR